MKFDESLIGIGQRAQVYDVSGEWPSMDLAELADAGAMRWAVAGKFEGEELSAFELHRRYEELATVSVATALILTQRDAAVGLIEAAMDAPSRGEMLERLSRNNIWATVGIAQLTTSRQGGRPAVAARRIEGGYVVDGVVPWCTGAERSGYIVTGAAMEEGQQVLFVLQREQAGVRVDPAMEMVALKNTLTSSIQLRQVVIEDRWVLRHPSSSALSGRRNGLTLGQTFIATGLTQGALNLIAKHDSDRARAAHDRFAQQLAEVRGEVKELCAPEREAEAQSANARLRGACNDLALRVTHAAVALYKGTALLRDHPAQRLAREAMFLLVWSCPNPVIDCTVDLLVNEG